MSGFLLDTNCISELVRIQPDSRVLRWFGAAEEQTLHLSVFSLGEIRRGIERLAAGKRRERLEHWLEVDLRERFSDRILPVDAAVADRWGVIVAESYRRGRVLPVLDAVLAATAAQHDLTVVTRNVRDFDGAGVLTLDPWAAP